MMPPIAKTVTVPLPPDQAFDLFTKGIDEWWPKARRGRDGRRRKVSTVRLSEGRGGRLTETTPEGEETRLGTITRWVPGQSLTILWQEGGAESVVTVAFTPAEQGTRVDLTHADLPVVTALLAGPNWDIRLSAFAQAPCPVPV